MTISTAQKFLTQSKTNVLLQFVTYTVREHFLRHQLQTINNIDGTSWMLLFGNVDEFVDCMRSDIFKILISSDANLVTAAAAPAVLLLTWTMYGTNGKGR